MEIEPMPVEKKAKRFNWRGNRPRMGKRSMCVVCGCLIHCAPFSQCPRCGEIGAMYDVGYEDKEDNRIQDSVAAFDAEKAENHARKIGLIE